MNADLQPLTNETVRNTAIDLQSGIDAIKEEEIDAFDEEAEDSMLRSELRKLIRFDGDYLKGFQDLLAGGKVNLKVEDKLETMINDTSEQIHKKPRYNRVSVPAPEFVKF